MQTPGGLMVLDVGAGTGLVGKALMQQVPGLVVDAFDLSVNTLKIAKEKQVYRHLWVGNDESMVIESFVDGNFASGSPEFQPHKNLSSLYYALICVGALNVGHINRQIVLPNFISTVKPQKSLVAFTTRMDFYQQHSKEIQNRLVDEKKRELMEMRDVGLSAVKDMPHIHWLYRTL